MAMKKEADGEHPASHYLVVEDPTKVSTWHLRVYDAAGKLDHGLMGAAKAALTSPGGHRGQPYAGPDKAKAISKLKALYKREGMTFSESGFAVAFLLDGHSRREGDVVIRRGKIFEGGDYEDKQFYITPEELAAAAAAFSPVPLDLEHMSTPLDGKLGELRAVEVGADGWSLYGEVALPAVLDDLLEGTGRKVSATWDRGSKTLTGLALVNHPRISDAALMAAFAASSTRHDTYDGQRAIQAAHDLAAKSGALCDPENPNGTQRYSSSYFVSSHERTGLQAVHDAATAHGARCSAMGTSSTYAEVFSTLFAGQRHSAADAKDIQAIHDLAAKQGADCAPAKMSTRRQRVNLKFWQKATPAERAEFRAAGVEVPEESTFSDLDAMVEQRMAEERARFTAQLREAQAARVATEAAAFADGLIQQSKAFPAEREALIAAYTQATVDDATHGAVRFADGKTTSRVDTLKALYAGRPAHDLTKETIDPSLGVRIVPAILGGDGQAVEMSALTPTPDGKTVAPERAAYLLKVAGLPAKNGSN